jgi:NADH-quinone oxidoreductase subunit I
VEDFNTDFTFHAPFVERDDQTSQMKKAIAEFYGGVKSLVVGLKITIGQFFKPSITVQYPHQSLPMSPRFRGHIELVRDPETGKAVCFACKLCERACPSDCIVVDGAKLDGAKKKSVTKYILDFTKCSLCGSCVEACRDGAIRFSREYNRVGLSREEFIMDLFKKLETEAQATPAPAVEPAQPTASAAPAASQPATAIASPPPPAAAPETKPAIEPEKVAAK